MVGRRRSRSTRWSSTRRRSRRATPTGRTALIELATEFADRGIVFALARVESSILDLWTRAGAVEAIGAEHVYPTVSDAVEELRARR